jgi:parvulin-like peptidyl-prolyl isomerase
MKRLCSFFLISLVGAGVLFAQVGDLQTVAVVTLNKTQAITGKQLTTAIDSARKQIGRSLTDDEKREVLDAKINQVLMLQAAEKDRIQVSANELNTGIAPYREQAGQEIGKQTLSDAEFSKWIKDKFDMEYAEWREEVSRTATIQKYIQSKKADVLKAAKAPSTAEVVEYYNYNKAKMVWPDMVRYSMISVIFGADAAAAAKTKAKEQADKLGQEIGSDLGKFDAVIAGAGPNSDYQAGESYLPRTEEARQFFGKPLLDAAFSLKQGQVSKVVESPLGYHIFKITQSLDQKNLGLDDPIQPGTNVTVRAYITQILSQQNMMLALKKANDEVSKELRGPANRPNYTYRKENIPWWDASWK